MIHRFKQMHWSKGQTTNPVQTDHVIEQIASEVKTWVKGNPQSAFVVAVAAGFVVGLLTKEQK